MGMTRSSSGNGSGDRQVANESDPGTVIPTGLSVRICRGDAADIAQLQALELDAARRYATWPDYGFCQSLPARSAGEHMDVQTRGVSLVATQDGDPVGFLLAIPVDGQAHVLETAVARILQGRGIGRSLFDELHTWARRTGFDEVTLTTYRDPPWNAPFYIHLGYKPLVVDERRPQLKQIQAAELEQGLPRMPRLAMVRAVQPEPGSTEP